MLKKNQTPKRSHLEPGESRHAPGAWVILLLLATAVIATSPFWLFLLTSKSGVQPPPRRIAVLPFLGAENSDDQKILDGLVRGVAEEMTRYRRLETVPSRESQTFRAEQSDLRQVARVLGIDFMVTGSVLRAKNDLRLKVYLAGVHRPNLPFWLKDYQLPGGKPNPTLPHRIAGDVVRAISEFR